MIATEAAERDHDERSAEAGERRAAFEMPETAAAKAARGRASYRGRKAEAPALVLGHHSRDNTPKGLDICNVMCTAILTAVEG